MLGIIFFVLYLIVSFANAWFTRDTVQNYGENMMQQGIWGDMMKQVVQDEIPADADTIVTDAPIVDTPAQ